MITGSCLCSAITFHIGKVGNSIAHCHCKMCQKFHGAAFSTFAEVERKHFTIAAGEKNLSHYNAENNTVRSFCKTCGSSLFFESDYNRQDKTIEISLATFDHIDDLKSIKPDAHIFTESKASWVEINDNLTKHTAFRN